MLRISGSFSAENCVKASETKLQEFGITTEKHIVAYVTDGANLVENTVEVEDKSHEEEDNGESEELAEDLDKALDLEFESGVGIDALFHVTYAEKNSTTNINETIKKIRNVVKLFRKSPIKNDILQKYVMATKKSLAVKRWCSQLASLDKNNALREIKLRLSYLQGKSTTMSVMAHQTEKEWNLADEKIRQRMSQTQADCAAEQHASRLEDAHLQAHHSCFTTSERR
ncbi:hypothetical protein TNCV_874831 [Trichonephila clavipes]|nr:hypothetical protein TNCV_874831 [Trichonephila clavipes]